MGWLMGTDDVIKEEVDKRPKGKLISFGKDLFPTRINEPKRYDEETLETKPQTQFGGMIG